MDGKSPDLGLPNESSTNLAHVEPAPDSIQKTPAFDPNETFHEEPLEPKFAAELEEAMRKLRNEAHTQVLTGPETGTTSQDSEEGLGYVLSKLTSAPRPPSDKTLDINDQTPAKKPRTVLQKIGHLISETKDQAQLTSIMIAQLGGIHPARVDGGWHWVAGKYANIAYDPRQWEPAGIDNHFYHKKFKPLKDKGVKIIGRADLPNGEIPHLRPLGLTGLQYLDHNRIKAALDLGLEIRVEFDHYDTYN